MHDPQQSLKYHPGHQPTYCNSIGRRDTCDYFSRSCQLSLVVQSTLKCDVNCFTGCGWGQVRTMVEVHVSLATQSHPPAATHTPFQNVCLVVPREMRDPHHQHCASAFFVSDFEHGLLWRTFCFQTQRHISLTWSRTE